MYKQEKLEDIALIGNPDSHGYKAISSIDCLKNISMKRYSPENIHELNQIKKELIEEIKFGCIFICTSIFQKNKNYSESKETELPVGLSLLKILREKNSINQDSYIVVMAEKEDKSYKNIAEKYGADKYID